MTAAGVPVTPSTGVAARPRRPARELLLEAAARLFYANGVAATGIDTITAGAGVAKKSLYNNFSSKADLVAGYLEARHGEWLGLYRKRLESAHTPREQVLAIFDAYLDHANVAYQHGFRGCGLLNAAAELPAGDPGRVAVRRHKEEVQQLLAENVATLLPGQQERTRVTAAHLAFLLEGAMARAGLEGTGARLKEARHIAGQLLDAL
ncbi:TetR/AcrR family transcriptional regulator [Arthrobacter sp. FW306-07-I]|uniref:TetR/AcrR family transcriptional regulator n=1 Tax=Arthrobacter sp. FW306-07-I TaxID=2879622 RepID=UPI001F3F5FB6|nr:TetR/AcrR family transcriptional regulator [Arthrobacter sp. FW306-07-I]UKA75796.1 TetR/AcrR family transcriptional regulator [Arthrobacter sp. FW306-07-I]